MILMATAVAHTFSVGQSSAVLDSLAYSPDPTQASASLKVSMDAGEDGCAGSPRAADAAGPPGSHLSPTPSRRSHKTADTGSDDEYSDDEWGADG